MLCHPVEQLLPSFQIVTLDNVGCKNAVAQVVNVEIWCATALTGTEHDGILRFQIVDRNGNDRTILFRGHSLSQQTGARVGSDELAMREHE